MKIIQVRQVHIYRNGRQSEGGWHDATSLARLGGFVLFNSPALEGFTILYEFRAKPEELA